jgi:hypothetical protein
MYTLYQVMRRRRLSRRLSFIASGYTNIIFFSDLSIIIIIFAPLPFSVRKVIEQPIVGPLCHTSLVNNLRSFSVLLNFHLGWRRYRMFDLEPSEWNQPDISFILTRERAKLVQACILLVAFAHYSLAVAGFAAKDAIFVHLVAVAVLPAMSSTLSTSNRGGLQSLMARSVFGDCRPIAVSVCIRLYI